MKLDIRCDKYQFDEARHKHYISGKEVTGTTTVVGVIDKPALMHWAVKVVTEKLGKLIKTIPYDEALIEAKKEPLNKKQEAGRFGTVVHAICEHFNNTGVVLSCDSEELPQDVRDLAKTFNPSSEKRNKTVQLKAEKLVGQYVSWFKANNVKVLYVEQNVFSESDYVGGIFDMVLEVAGKTYIADFKTSSGVYPSQFIQMGGYHVQLDDMTERGYIDPMDIAGYIVIHLPRKGNITVHIKKETKEYRRAFKACLYIYRLINEQLWSL